MEKKNRIRVEAEEENRKGEASLALVALFPGFHPPSVLSFLPFA